VLSIGKLAAGQASYYLEQAHGSVTRAGAVSSGIEDYYLSGPEASGTCAGAGVVGLGLSGTVDEQALDRVLAGEHPMTGEPLGRVLASRVPKSVSVLFGVGRDAARAWWRACDCWQRPCRCCVPPSHLARRRPAAPHPCACGESDAGRRWPVVDARRSPDLCAREDRRLSLRGAAAEPAEPRARRRVDSGPQWDR
jgi:hypothetical protein